jgi:hypothetical protein
LIGSNYRSATGVYWEAAVEDREVVVRFMDVSTAQGNQLAQELKSVLEESAVVRGASDFMRIEVTKERLETQDFGATLVVILGTPAAIVLAKGIYDFISKYGNRVVVTTKDGSILATGDAARNIDVAKATKALQGG